MRDILVCSLLGNKLLKHYRVVHYLPHTRSVSALLNTNVSYEHWRTVENKWKSLQEDADDIFFFSTSPPAMMFLILLLFPEAI